MGGVVLYSYCMDVDSLLNRKLYYLYIFPNDVARDRAFRIRCQDSSTRLAARRFFSPTYIEGLLKLHFKKSPREIGRPSRHETFNMSEATPRITAPYLEQFSHQTVRILGKVRQLRGEQATIDAGGQIQVFLNRVCAFESNSMRCLRFS